MDFSSRFPNNKFMKTIIGIDISSKTLDICVKNGNQVNHYVVNNDIKAIKAFLKKHNVPQTIVAMENTGRYNWNLFEVLPAFDFKVYVIPPLHLKKSLGLVRGKNDKIDALRVCSFIEKHESETLIWRPTSVALKKVKVLLAERGSRIKMKTQLLRQQHDYKLFKNIALDKELLKLNQKMLETLDAQIVQIEASIEKALQADETLKHQSQLIRTVPGAGKVLSWMILAKTNGFQNFSSPRKMACYCGVVPFDYQSGSSIKNKPRVSIFADKAMKTVLHLAAMSAIRLDNDLRIYYRRKVDEGKNKMLVLNAVRNKIIHRIFALIKNQTTYVNDLVLS